MSNEGPENPISSTLTEGLKRKRGRPKKQPQEDGGNTAVIPQDAVEPQPVKKPRGRPKGSKKVTGLTGGTTEPAGKKRRGRPRKWPQAVVQEGESQGGDPLESSDLNLNSAPATQGLKLDHDNYTRLNGAAMLWQTMHASLEKMVPGPTKPLVSGEVLSNIPAAAQ
ncbi:hypothetical protein Nmel_012570 [Mimus melanotis]